MLAQLLIPVNCLSLRYEELQSTQVTGMSYAITRQYSVFGWNQRF